jgi:superfamily II DNA or RNA helicase
LISTPLLKEGADFPLLRSLIMGGSGKSLVNTIQAVGRVLRPGPYKDKKPIVVDFLDHTRYVMKHALARRRILEEEIGPVRVLPTEHLPEL